MDINIGAPETIWIVLFITALVIEAALDGKPRTGEHRFGVAFMGRMLGAGLLYWGGFFS